MELADSTGFLFRILLKHFSIKSHENPISDCRVVTGGHMDKETGRHLEFKRRTFATFR
jgi:hypothetical protein